MDPVRARSRAASYESRHLVGIGDAAVGSRDLAAYRPVKFTCPRNDGNDRTGATRSKGVAHTSLSGPWQRAPVLSINSATKAVTPARAAVARPSMTAESTASGTRISETTRCLDQIQ